MVNGIVALCSFYGAFVSVSVDFKKFTNPKSQYRVQL